MSTWVIAQIEQVFTTVSILQPDSFQALMDYTALRGGESFFMER